MLLLLFLSSACRSYHLGTGRPDVPSLPHEAAFYGPIKILRDIGLGKEAVTYSAEANVSVQEQLFINSN